MRWIVSGSVLLSLTVTLQAFAPQRRTKFATSQSRRIRQQQQPLYFADRATDAVSELKDKVASITLSTNDATILNQKQFDIDLTSSSPSPADSKNSFLSDDYKKGFAIISLITLFNASIAPVWHYVYEGNHSPPPLFLNAIVSAVAFLGLVAFAPILDSKVDRGSKNMAAIGETKWSKKSFRGGMELGLWKGLGTTCHIYGMALTTANHGAFLLQLTTLIVPVLQGLRGAEVIPRRVQLAVALALAGIFAFTQDPSGVSDVPIDAAQMQTGDLLVLGAAFFYSLYDIQTYYWGKEVPRTELVTIKVGFQAILSCALCAIVGRQEVLEYFANAPNYAVLVPTILWSGLIVNALATFLQVGGIQAVGPTRAQTIFASQPLWASIMDFFFLGETMGPQGFVGGGSFLGALFLAATSDDPVDPEGNDSKNNSKILVDAAKKS
ncbi:hypothetical protein MPSEU_000071400 [Mayamaea pseudoterrestris]|nr:hypothetical protein MPSEU_000071400 [Mayamaea pseudoterrestris]